MPMEKLQRADHRITRTLDLATKKTKNNIHFNIQAHLNLYMPRDKNPQLKR